MSNVIKFLIELILTFIVVYVIYYFAIIRRKKNYNPNFVPVEINILLLKYRINIKKVNYKKMLKLVSLVCSIDISLVVTLLSWYIKNAYLIILLSLVFLLPITILSFHFIGRHFEKISLSK